MVLERERDGFVGFERNEEGKRDLVGVGSHGRVETVNKFFEINWILIVRG